MGTCWSFVWYSLSYLDYSYLESTIIQDVQTSMPDRAGEPVSGCSSSCNFLQVALRELKRINDHVYEVGKQLPKGIVPSVEFVFFHDIQWRNPDDQDIFLRTWMSEDGSEVWPNWLKQPETFLEARVLFTSYDAWAQETSTGGLLDEHLLPESLLISLITARVGQHDCPVILIGHGIGCLVLKAVCYRAFLSSKLDRTIEAEVGYFLNQIHGAFLFSPPCLGMDVADEVLKISASPGPWLKIMKPLSKHASRLNDFFMKLRHSDEYEWKIMVVAATQSFSLQLQPEDTNSAELQVVSFECSVKEGSSRVDNDGYVSIAATHFSISRLSSRESIFSLLERFARKSCNEMDSRQDIQSIRESLPQHTFGLEHVAQQLQEMLSRTEAATKFVGFTGMGGIGKSTLARTLYKNICVPKSAFEYTCILDMQDDDQFGPNIVIDELKLKRKIMAKMFRWGKKTRMKRDWSALRGKKVLVLLDDVKNKSQILEANKDHGLGPGSWVMATSRDRIVLAGSGFEVHDVKELSKEDSKNMFHHAFGGIENIDVDFSDHVSKLVSMCDGLPLALKEVSNYLHTVARANERMWEDTICRVERAHSLDGVTTSTLWDPLSRSYFALEDMEKNMFMDLATCFYEEEAEEVVAAWNVLYPREAFSGCLNLVNKSLAKCRGDFESMCLTGEDVWFSKGTCLMTKHRLLQSLGRKMYREDGKLKNGRVHVFDAETASELLQLHHFGAQALSKIRIIKIDKWERESSFFMDAEFICKLNSLQVLWLKELEVSLPENDEDSSKLKSIGSLWWRQSKANGIARLIHGPSLQHLNCKPGPNMMLEFPLCLSGTESCYTALEHLVLNSFELGELPDCFAGLPNLQHLEISNCSKLRQVPPSFSTLKKLRRLLLISLDNLHELPETFVDFLHLSQFELRKCCKLEHFGSLGTLQHLRHLVLEGLQLHELPEFSTRVVKLRSLVLKDCCNLRTLPCWFADLPKLQHLKLAGLCNLCQPPAIFTILRARLETLDISSLKQHVN